LLPADFLTFTIISNVSLLALLLPHPVFKTGVQGIAMPFSLLIFTRNNVIAVCLLVVVAIAGLTLNKRFTGKVSAEQKTEATADTKPKDVDSIVPEGMPIGIAAATEEDNEKGHEIKATISGKGIGKINSIAYTTYEFDPTGNLVRVEGGIKRVDLEAGKDAPLPIIPQRQSNPKNRLMIALEKATSDKESWSASHLELANAGAEKVKSKTASALKGKKDKDAIDEDFGSGFCINGYRRAVELSAAGGEKTPPTSFTCDQNERAYAFTFAGKTLIK
jgi:hypothetical protein